MSIEASYHSEVRFVRSAHSSKTGTTITLALPDSDELSKVAGFDGKRYMLALVEIGDDEQPVQKPSAKHKGGFISRWLALRCADPAFWRFLCEAFPSADLVWSEQGAADLVRVMCGVQSRAEIDHCPVAKDLFERLIRLPYMKWCAMNGVTQASAEA